MALSGIAIAIGTMVDMGVILVREHPRAPGGGRGGPRAGGPALPLRDVIHRATTEVGSAVVTAVATTIICFLPVFTMVAAEGKLFKPLAFTKTFALVSSVVLALVVLPPLAQLLLRRRGVRTWTLPALPARWNLPQGVPRPGLALVLAVLVALLLAARWLPLGAGRSLAANSLFVLVVVVGLLGAVSLFRRAYPAMLAWCLDHKPLFLAAPVLLVVFGATVWLGFDRVFAFLPGAGQGGADGSAWSRLWTAPRHTLPGLGKEFMPPLDEGSFLYMPTTMPHASIGEALDVLAKLDQAIATIPEVEMAVGKLGRARSALDPAPISMIETVINYKPEYRQDEQGRRLRFRWDKRTGDFARDAEGELIPDRRGRPYRQWRPEIRSADDIWDEIARVAQLPGTTGAPQLQPIAARLVMLQSGMRAPMGVKVRGPSLEAIETVALAIERLLKQVPGVAAGNVIADRVVGKPYLEIVIDREALARYGLTVGRVQDVIEIAVGGRTVTTTVEGRERYPVRVRYARERRDDLDELRRVLVQGLDGAPVPLGDLVRIDYVRGPRTIKSEDTFLVGYVIFDKQAGLAEVDVVEAARDHLQARRDAGELVLPAGVSYSFAGSYENQVRSQKTLSLVLPLALVLIFLVL